METLDKYSCVDGLEINFYDNENKITLKSNLFFPWYEKIYINGDLIDKEFIFFKNEHSFRFKKDNYVIKYSSKKLFKGPIVITLIKNGVDLRKKRVLIENLTKKEYIVQIFILGLILGFLSGIANSYGVPFFLIVIFAMIMPYVVWLCRLFKRIKIIDI